MVELFLLAAALSADNFAVSIGYGSSNTRISPGMTALLNLFCSAALVASAQFGKRFLQSAGPGMGNQGGGGLLFSYGNAENFRRTEKTAEEKSREEQKQDRNIWKNSSTRWNLACWRFRCRWMELSPASLPRIFR